MTGPSVAEPHVAVYIDFDNVVISRYDQVHTHTRDAWRSDNARRHAADEDSDDPIDVRLATARVDVGAILDYAASFGRVSLSRAYADWSVPANAAYRHQLVDRAVDLTQLFPVSGTKNGADIRLSVDAMEDLGKYSDLTHVVLVAGDSDYIALAQRCKQLGRYVVGIGVAGSTSRALIAACDEFSSYDALPGVTPAAEIQAEAQEAAAQEAAAQEAALQEAAVTEGGTSHEKAQAASAALAEVSRGVASGRIAAETPPPTRKRARKVAAEPSPEELRQRDATNLLVRAIRIAQDRNDEDEWLFGGGVKSQMQRMDAGFKEKPLGYKTFTAFVESRSEVVESRVDPDDGQLRLRLRGR
ncbi:NYN domain-containing protein [Millisia brevis]|uniref:NYN domain-containing protein n=1 Tax=Millisia brevis TaxID=264148 RepID=UPI00082E2CBD|nr:NYN domain-containing protein [Millisia brevis]